MAMGLRAMGARADTRAVEFGPIIAKLQAAGVTTQTGLAEALNDAGIPTITGRGKWHASQVRSVLDRLDRMGAAGRSPRPERALA
jgi:hypothetical protein